MSEKEVVPLGSYEGQRRVKEDWRIGQYHQLLVAEETLENLDKCLALVPGVSQKPPPRLKRLLQHLRFHQRNDPLSQDLIRLALHHASFALFPELDEDEKRRFLEAFFTFAEEHSAPDRWDLLSRYHDLKENEEESLAYTLKLIEALPPDDPQYLISVRTAWHHYMDRKEHGEAFDFVLHLFRREMHGTSNCADLCDLVANTFDAAIKT